MQINGVASFKNLDIPYTRVRDVCVHARRTVPPWTSSRASRDRLVVRSAPDHGSKHRPCLVIPPSRNSHTIAVLASSPKCKVAARAQSRTTRLSFDSLCTSLASSTRMKCLQYDVNDSLRRKDIASTDSSRSRRRQQRLLRNFD